MTTSAASDPIDTSESDLHRLLMAQKRHWQERLPISHTSRIADLKRLRQAIRSSRSQLINAMQEDYGQRSWHECLTADLLTLDGEIAHMCAHLRSWMKRRRVSVSPNMLPARAWIEYQPLGVVGVMSPWNYPVNLALAPLATAISAGNHVMCKPSEHTPATTAIIAEIVRNTFEPEQVAIVTGGIDVSRDFAALPFDHLFFTGSTEVGRRVMQAAARNLTPVTLELGGKSPVLLDNDIASDRVATSLTKGKWFNAGQSCTAPDYVLGEHKRIEELAGQLAAALSVAYPGFPDNDDYSAVINDDQFTRLDALLDSSAAQRIMRPLGEGDREKGLFPPTIVINPDPASALMQEEIFGPILVLMASESLDHSIEFINARPKPLALYYYGNNDINQRRVLDRTTAGGVCINENLVHFAEPALPFGGVGESGTGEYHGHAGFLALSKKKPVLQQARWSPLKRIRAPYRGLVDRIIRLIAG